MIRLLKNIFDRSTQVKIEQTDLANTAIRIGTLLEDLAKLGVSSYDNTASYEVGQFAIHEGVLAEVLINTNPGESPVTAPAKWSRKIVTDKNQITLGNNLPVTASALLQVLSELGGSGDIPNASTYAKGKARQATKIEVKNGVNDDAFITPLDLHDAIGASIPPGNTTAQTLDQTAKTGTLNQIGKTDQYVQFTGGMASLLPETSLDFPTVVSDPLTGKFYQRGGTAVGSDPPEIIFMGCHEEDIEVLTSEKLVFVGKLDGSTLDHHLDTLNPLLGRLWILNDDGVYDPATPGTLTLKQSLTTTQVILNIPGGGPLTGILELEQHP